MTRNRGQACVTPLWTYAVVIGLVVAYVGLKVANEQTVAINSEGIELVCNGFGGCTGVYSNTFLVAVLVVLAVSVVVVYLSQRYRSGRSGK